MPRAEETIKTRPILVIDDDPRSCELVVSILEGAWFKVLSAPDGPSGIETARAAQPAVIILDMMMPGINGVETCQRLKQDPILRDIPVVGVTASADPTYTAKVFRAGAEFFLPKPFSAHGLIHVVKLAEELAQNDPRRHRRGPHPRFPAELPVRCLAGGEEGATREIVGRTGNVSLGGLLLLLPERLAPGTVFRLWLRLPEGAIPAEGVVVWQNPQPMGDGRIRHGTRLLGFANNADLVRYRRYLSQIAAGRF